MPLISEPITSLETVVAGGTASAGMQLDRRYHNLSFQAFLQPAPTEQVPAPVMAPAPAEDVIDWIKCVVGTQDIRNLSARRIRQINATNKHPDPENVVTLNYAEPWQEGYDAQVATAWPMWGEENFTVYVKLKPQPAGAIAKITGVQTYDRLIAQRFIGDEKDLAAGKPSVAGLVQRQVPIEIARAGTPGWQTIRPVVRQLANTHPLNAGKNTIDGKDIGLNICRLWFFATGDAEQPPISHMRILADGEQVHDLTRAESVALLARYDIELPDAVPGLACFDLNGRTEWLTANRGMVYELTAPAAQSVDRVAESIAMGFK